MVDGETKAKLNGAIRDALRKEKVSFIEVTTEALEGNVVVLTIVAGADVRDKVSRIFTEVAKRTKSIELRLELKTPEALAKEKAATLRMVLQALTSGEAFTPATLAEKAHEPSWVIVACLKALAAKGILQHVGEYDDNPTWAVEPKYATYELAAAAASAKGFDVG